MYSTLSSSCFRSDPPLSRHDAALAHFDSLPPHNLVFCTDGYVPFAFGKSGSGILANCSLCDSRSGRNCLLSPPVLSDFNESTDTRFPQETTRLMSWPDGKRYFCPLQFFVVSLLFSLVSTLLFSWIGGIQSHRNSLTHRFPRFPPRNLCFLVTLAVFSLVYAATDTAFC